MAGEQVSGFDPGCELRDRRSGAAAVGAAERQCSDRYAIELAVEERVRFRNGNRKVWHELGGGREERESERERVSYVKASGFAGRREPGLYKSAMAKLKKTIGYYQGINVRAWTWSGRYAD